MNPAPFILEDPHKPKRPPRAITTREGLGDHMRIAAFAELQAISAFRDAAEKFTDAPEALRQAWLAQIPDEEKHYHLIMARMAQLGIGPDDMPVSVGLTRSLNTCTTAEEFCIKICSAEHRGLLAARRLISVIGPSDPETAAVFQQIADDEIAHVTLAETFFGWTPDRLRKL